MLLKKGDWTKIKQHNELLSLVDAKLLIEGPT